jgi:hypothetical protein
MCLPLIPVLVASLVISMASAAATAGMSIHQQQTQQKAEKHANDLARTAAIRGMNVKNAQVAQQQMQERDAATGKINSNNIAANEALSTAQAAAGSGGVTGISVDSLMSGIAGGQGRYNASVAQNLKGDVAANDWNRINNYNDMYSTVSKLKRPSAVDYAGEGLKLTSSIASSVSSFGTGMKAGGGTNTTNRSDTNWGTQLSIDQVNSGAY